MLLSFQVYSKPIKVDRIYTMEEEEIIKNYLGTFYIKGHDPAKHLAIMLGNQYGKIAVLNYFGGSRYLCTPEFDDFDLYEGMNASTCMFLDCVDIDAKEGDSFDTPYIIYCKTENGIDSLKFLNGKFAYTEYKRFIKEGSSPADIPISYLSSITYYLRLNDE